jgi:hypothetical protein
MAGDGRDLNVHQLFETHLLQHAGGRRIGFTVGCWYEGRQKQGGA